MTRVVDVLSYLEEHLDAAHITEVKARLKRTLCYQQADRMAINICCPAEHNFQWYPYAEAFTDVEKMMVNELIPCCSHPEFKSDSLPMIRANYGVGTMPTLFGLDCQVVENNLPWVAHVGADQIKEILRRGVPDLRTGLGGRVFDTIQYYHEQLAAFPLCQQLVRVYHPDLQGPFDVAHLIWGSDIFIALYDEPELVHELLQLVTETYIAYMKELKKVLNDEDGDFNYHWGSLYPGRVLLRDDTPVILSKETYEEFVQPYDEQILAAFGGGTIHYCGRADQWVFSMMETKGLKGMNFGQPPNMEFGFDFIDKIYGGLKARNIAVGGYYVDHENLEKVLNSDFRTGVTYMTTTENLAEAQRIFNLLR
ncbi:MAG: hypothetical protein WCL54_09070 [Clostridia bacterium]